MNEFIETPKDMSYITGQSTKGIVTPTLHPNGPLRACRCGVSTTTPTCAVCQVEARAGISIRVGLRA